MVLHLANAKDFVQLLFSGDKKLWITIRNAQKYRSLPKSNHLILGYTQFVHKISSKSIFYNNPGVQKATIPET